MIDIQLPIEYIEETSSTNSFLARLCREGKAKEYHTVIAERQTEGRGQRGNSWESEPGKNLTFSMVLYPTLKAKEQFRLSMMTAFAVIHALKSYTDGFSIKWPNDIYWKDKKIGGILIENELESGFIIQSIIGIGLNVNQTTFHSPAPNPVSLQQILGVEIDKLELFQKILAGLIGGYHFLEHRNSNAWEVVRNLYLDHLYRKEGYHPYRDANGEFKAEFQSIEPDGHLVLRDEEGKTRRYAFKEVEFILP